MKISKYQGINLYIKNIEDEVDEERLRKEFSNFGVIKSCKIMLDEKGNSKGFGFVCFSTAEESSRALEMNGRILPGCNKPLYVAMHEPKEIRRQKLSVNASYKMRGGISQPGAIYSQPPGQVFFPQGANISQGFVYPQPMPSMPRGWGQAQYPPPGVPYPAHNVGLMPQRGGTSAPSNRSGGGRATTTVRSNTAGAGRGSRRSGSPNVPESAPPAAETISIAQAKALPLEQQKLYIGEKLYSLIAPSHPVLAGKITGMFLESGWHIDELYGLLNDEVKLNEKIEDAISVLQKAQEMGDSEPVEESGH